MADCPAPMAPMARAPPPGPPAATPAIASRSEPTVRYCARSRRAATWRWVTWASSWASTPASSSSRSRFMIMPVKTKTYPPGTAKALRELCRTTVALKLYGWGGRALTRRSSRYLTYWLTSGSSTTGRLERTMTSNLWPISFSSLMDTPPKKKARAGTGQSCGSRKVSRTSRAVQRRAAKQRNDILSSRQSRAGSRRPGMLAIPDPRPVLPAYPARLRPDRAIPGAGRRSG